MLEELIPQWPDRFPNLHQARQWVKHIYQQNSLELIQCPGHTPSKTRKHIINRLTLIAYDAGKFAVDKRPTPSSAHVPKQEEEKSPWSPKGFSGGRTSSLISISSRSPAISAADQDDELPQTPPAMAVSQHAQDHLDFSTITPAIVDTNEDYLAARFAIAEQMLSNISLHPADKKAQEMEDELAKATENLVKTGIVLREEYKSFTG